MELKKYELMFNDLASKKIDWLKSELQKIRSGRAMPNMFDNIKAEYYGEMTPINQMAQIQIPEPREIIIKPYDRSSINSIQTALNKPELHLNSQIDGDKIRIKLPQLTEENRKEYVKHAKQIGEKAKQEIRLVRRDVLQKIKQDKHEDEDFVRFLEEEVEKFTKKFNNELDSILQAKEKELTTI
ncbi:ribosome recycling factor [Mycoplasmoides alvi]|uniref:ribosome recycling factor n=1 Tax=Mycoplasmoides alvi TaxID=78580 RepID=UPI00069765DF|nr:ribosome recycling factor [Mycoplasmoides alvi]